MKRIQRQRTRGWKMPEGAVYVGRPSRWRNRWRVGDVDPWTGERLDAAAVVSRFRYRFDSPTGRAVVRAALAGHDLVCWCPLDQPCHADVLLELANR